MRIRIATFCAAVLLINLIALAAQSEIVISNLNGDDGTESFNLNDVRSKAMGFTMGSGSDYVLEIATLRFETFGSNTQANIELWSNNNGLLGSKLETLSNPGSFNSSGIANYEFMSAGTTLQANQSYWLLAYGTSSGSRFDWMASDPGTAPTGSATHLGALYDDNGPPPTNDSSILNSYSITARVPEPTSFMMFGLAMAVMARRRR